MIKCLNSTNLRLLLPNIMVKVKKEFMYYDVMRHKQNSKPKYNGQYINPTSMVKMNVATSQNLNLTLRCSRIGGDLGQYRITYFSKTKELLLRGIARKENKEKEYIKKKRLSKSDDMKLKKEIIQSEFFESASAYPSDAGQSYSQYTLSVEMDHKTHTVSWTDIPPIVPSGLFKIVDKIEKLVGASRRESRTKKK
jgi:hypothetical protein